MHRCRFRCVQMSMSNVDRVPCKCRWKCRKYIDLSRGKSPKKPESYVEKMQSHMLIYIYIYIYIYTHTHTHLQKGSFFKHLHEKKCKELGTDTYVDVDGSSKCRPDMVDVCAPRPVSEDSEVSERTGNPGNPETGHQPVWASGRTSRTPDIPTVHTCIN